VQISRAKYLPESGLCCAQADGAILVHYGDTVVLVTAVSLKSIREGVDFLPLTVDYQEMTFAAGKFPADFLNVKAVLTNAKY